MAIARKPQANKISEKDVEAVISKGGSVASETSNSKLQQSEKSEHPVVVRIPADLLEKIDEKVGKRRIKTSRHTWLLEAIIEKLDSEAENQ